MDSVIPDKSLQIIDRQEMRSFALIEMMGRAGTCKDVDFHEPVDLLTHTEAAVACSITGSGFPGWRRTHLSPLS